MLRGLSCATLLAILTLPLKGGPQRIPFPRLDSLLTAGIDFTLRQEYETAMETFRETSRQFPDHPAGYLYQAAVIQTMAMDYEEIPQDGQFDSLLTLAGQNAQSLIDRFPDSPWGYYFKGTTLGHDSYARAQRGDWFGGVTKGLSAVSHFRKSVERDTLFYDAYLGIGTYSYWKSRKIQFLTWLPFISDDRKKGIELLRQCADAGAYNAYASIGALVSVYLDAEEFDKALDCSSRGLKEYPENRIFLWGRATALDRAGLQAEALEAYETLLRVIMGDSRSNLYNELVCRLRLASLLSEDGRTEEAEGYLESIAGMERKTFPRHLRERAAEKFRRARELLGMISSAKKSQD